MSFIATIIQEMGGEMTNEDAQLLETILNTLHRFSINNSIHSVSG